MAVKQARSLRKDRYKKETAFAVSFLIGLI